MRIEQNTFCVYRESLFRFAYQYAWTTNRAGEFCSPGAQFPLQSERTSLGWGRIQISPLTPRHRQSTVSGGVWDLRVRLRVTRCSRTCPLTPSRRFANRDTHRDNSCRGARSDGVPGVLPLSFRAGWLLRYVCARARLALPPLAECCSPSPEASNCRP